MNNTITYTNAATTYTIRADDLNTVTGAWTYPHTINSGEWTGGGATITSTGIRPSTTTGGEWTSGTRAQTYTYDDMLKLIKTVEESYYGRLEKEERADDGDEERPIEVDESAFDYGDVPKQDNA